MQDVDELLAKVSNYLDREKLMIPQPDADEVPESPRVRELFGYKSA